MSPVRYELFFIFQNRIYFIVTAVKTLKSYIVITGWTLLRRRNVSPVKYELFLILQKTAFFIVTVVKTLKSYLALTGWAL
jgi:hypothetical protein